MQQLNRVRHLRFIAIALTSAFILLLWVAVMPILHGVGQPPSSTFEQVWQTVNDDFYDPDFNGVNWTDIKATYEPLANQAQSQAELAQVSLVVLFLWICVRWMCIMLILTIATMMSLTFNCFVLTVIAWFIQHKPPLGGGTKPIVLGGWGAELERAPIAFPC